MYRPLYIDNRCEVRGASDVWPLYEPIHGMYAMYSPTLRCSPLQRGGTPMHFAASNGHTPVVAALLADPRVEVNAKNNVRGGGEREEALR